MGRLRRRGRSWPRPAQGHAVRSRRRTGRARPPRRARAGRRHAHARQRPAPDDRRVQRESRSVLATVGASLDRLVERRPFELSYPDGFSITASRLPAPWHLVAALLRRARTRVERSPGDGAPARARSRPAAGRSGRIAMPRAGSPGTDRATPLIARLWRPLCIAALNTPLAEASAQVFANVLRDSLGADSAASMLWLPRSDLSALLPEAVERFVVRARRRACGAALGCDAIGPAEAGFRLDAGLGRFDAVVYAAPPAQLGRVASAFAPALADALDAIRRLRLRADLHRLPEVRRRPARCRADSRPCSMTPARRAYGQWVFDRGALDPANRGVVAVVVSAQRRARRRTAVRPVRGRCTAAHARTGAADGRARRARSSRSGRRWPRVRGCGGRRMRRACPGFVLAGDWTHSDYPSTLESAVRSGLAAARLAARRSVSAPGARAPARARAGRRRSLRGPRSRCLGAFALGISAIEKPSLAASRNRSWPRGAGRIFAGQSDLAEHDQLRAAAACCACEETIASSTARSAAGSAMRTPPTALTNTSWSKAAMPAWRCSTASSIARRLRSSPTERRRGFGTCAVSTSACTSTSSGRVPSCVTITHEPGDLRVVLRQEQRRRIADAAQAVVGHREHAEFVHRAEAVLERADQAEARVRVALEVQHRVDHVLEHARARRARPPW